MSQNMNYLAWIQMSMSERRAFTIDRCPRLSLDEVDSCIKSIDDACNELYRKDRKREAS